MRLLFPLLGLALTACTGTQITGRDVDTSQPYPDLHTVPDRPAKPDFAPVDTERQDFDQDYARKLQTNQSIRGHNKPPVRQETHAEETKH